MRALILLLLGIPIFLYIDSPYVAKYFNYSQHFATFLIALAFIYLYKRSNKRTRIVMLLGMVFGFLGEYFFSIILGMYHYRLGNIPLWVAFGHSMIFASVYRIIRKPFFIQHKQKIQNYGLLFIFFYALAWMVFANDLFGFCATLCFITLLGVVKKSRLFFTVMFFLVCYIELVGTSTMNWSWPNTLFGTIESIPSANPPTGVALFYILFDFAVLHTYFILYPKTRERYFRKRRQLVQKVI